ncbi:hypothetical protein HOD05_00510 [Candidatus Woesearchaeota archaeon]|jgi:hypothetical protein|nr:hypothetical protein [Candidatus Woesearchaeota archaeon]MBT4150889.1 hypothetical protein [Candidatus Woesearchaeota archaeon]MBT4247567.1 hypothetical protein [Candidatus Woesearchaeota archaeon]MBT4433679.1 hypothetical protein [Candidatus Woesearchaeota archaeon]
MIDDKIDLNKYAPFVGLALLASAAVGAVAGRAELNRRGTIENDSIISGVHCKLHSTGDIKAELGQERSVWHEEKYDGFVLTYKGLTGDEAIAAIESCQAHYQPTQVEK